MTLNEYELVELGLEMDEIRKALAKIEALTVEATSMVARVDEVVKDWQRRLERVVGRGVDIPLGSTLTVADVSRSIVHAGN